MIAVAQLLRIFTIQRVLIRHGFDELVLSIPLFRPGRFLLHLLPWNWRRRDYKPRGERIRAVLEELGPLFVKFGQILSTRRDLLADDIAETRAPGATCRLSPARPRAIVREAYGQSVEEVFSTSTKSRWPRRRSPRSTPRGCVTATRSSSRSCAPICAVRSNRTSR